MSGQHFELVKLYHMMGKMLYIHSCIEIDTNTPFSEAFAKYCIVLSWDYRNYQA